MTEEFPEVIYLLPGTGEDGEATWCDDPAPGWDMDPDDAIRYVKQPKGNHDPYYLTLGWAFGHICSLLDEGKDPRKMEVSEFMEAMKRDLGLKENTDADED